MIGTVPRRRPRHQGRRAFAMAHGALATVIAAAMLAVLAPAAAQAGNPITRLAAGPIAATTHCNPNLTAEQYVTTAGARTDYCMAYYMDGGNPETGDDTYKTTVDNPEGFLATSDTSPQCKLVDFAPERADAARCDPSMQTGSGEARVRVVVAGLTIQQTVPVKMWNLEHAPDAVAGVGLELAPNLGGIDLDHTKLVSYTNLRPNPNVGLRTTIEGMPRTTTIAGIKAPIAIDGFFLRFWGSKTDHPTLPQSFALLGSDCTKDQVTTLTTTSYSGDTQSASAKYRLTDCANVPFGIKATVETTERRPDVPTGTKVTVSVDQNFEPRVTSNLKSTTLTMPAGLELGAQVASGDPLELCTDEQFKWDSTEPVGCPAGSRVADVDIVSPLQANPFKGAGYLGVQKAPGDLPQVFIVGEFNSSPGAPRVKLKGQLAIDDQGRLTTTLSDLPQVLFEKFSLTFRGGDHAPMQTPRQCGTTEGQLVATPSNGNAPVIQALPLTIDQDCIDPNAFSPTMSITSSNPVAGGRGVTTVKVERPDRQARFSKMVVNLPQGILSDLKLATECPQADGDAGNCPASSRIGTMTALSGVGPAPYTVKGDVYLRERDPGSVASLLISAPVRFGPVDLGRLNLPARIELRPEDLGLRLYSDVPQRFKGLPLSLRSFQVDLDRPDFAMNPTNCDPLSSSSLFTSDTGATANVAGSFQVSGCEALGFDPKLAFKLSGQMGDGDKPGIDVTVSLPGTRGSNIKTTSVLMPPGLSADLKQVPRACPQANWDAGTCAPTAVIGTVEGRLAITDEQLTGTLSMVKIEGRTLPSIGMQFTGRFASKLLGGIAIDKATGQLVTQFQNVPDVPLVELALHLGGGPDAPLFSTADLCQQTPKMVGTFLGQSGATATRTVTAPCSAAYATYARPRITKKGSLRNGLTLKVSPPAAQKLSVVRVAIPNGVSVKGSARTKARLIKGTKLRLIGTRTIGASVPSAGASSSTVKLPKGTFSFTRTALKKKKLVVSVRLGYTGGGRDVVPLTVWR
ncbi:MAG: hypothetical protein J7513_06065 [Solirubrobacteraceae bacterium]|nr:hypothetical protein [Solirubrobacteraceae bacterium]